jgi:hypothetical protein
MSTPDENTRQAYIDGELSVSEMTDFEKSLSQEELKLLTSEKQFDGVIAEHLAQDATCPLEVWDRTKALLQSNDSSITEFSTLKKRRSPSMYWGIGSLVAAACIAFILINVATKVVPGIDPDSEPFRIYAESVEELAAQSQTSPTHEAVEGFLGDHDVMVELDPDIRMFFVHYGFGFLGAKQHKISDHKFLELLFACCDHPVKIVVAKRDSDAAKMLGQAVDSSNHIQATKIISDKNGAEFLAAVVGKHHAHGFLDIFANQLP